MSILNTDHKFPAPTEQGQLLDPRINEASAPGLSLDADYFRANGIRDEADLVSLRKFVSDQLNLSDRDVADIVDYLEARGREVRGQDRFGVVYDLTKYCNLNCAHCCVNAALTTAPGSEIRWETSTDQVKMILTKVHRYSNKRQLDGVRILFGGGEPTMRPDFETIAEYASKLFGVSGVGLNTNGASLTLDRLLSLAHYLGTIEISLDGFEEHHNLWRDPRHRSSVVNPFRQTLKLIRLAALHPLLTDKLEVTSAITTDNIGRIGEFVRFLESIGVRNYSVHRAMPVGRLAAKPEKIPSQEQYAHLLAEIARLRRTTTLNHLHIHHSLESIYSALVLGRDIHSSSLLSGSGRHSIGLSPKGDVYFDPWSMTPPFHGLSAGNLLDSNTELEDIVEGSDSVIRMLDASTKTLARCHGCRVKCSGGMRFNALAHFVQQTASQRGRIELKLAVAGLSQIDPACPLYEP